MKNMALLRRHLEKKGYAPPVRGTVIDGDAVQVSLQHRCPFRTMREL
jgi:hypothetical protein